MHAGLTRLRLMAGALLLLSAAPALAHHSASMYDRAGAIEVQGVVKAFNWVNPHASIVFIAQGSGLTWVVETTSPGVLTRNGWTKRSLKPGDRVRIKVAPLRSGGPAGAVLGLTNLETGVSLPGPI